MIKQIPFILTILFIAGLGYAIGYFIVDIPNQLQAVGLAVAILFYPILRFPLIGLYIVFILLPFIPLLRRFYYLIALRPANDPLIIIGDIISIIMLIGLFFEFRERPETDRKVRFIIGVVAVYFIYLLVRVFGFTQIPVLDGLAQFKFFGLPVLFFFIGVFYAYRRNDMKRLWSITFVVGVILVLYGSKQLHFGYSKAENLWFSAVSFSSLFIQGLARPFSTLQSPAAFADFCMIAVIGLLMVAKWGKSPLRYGLYAFVPLLLYGALITSVRSSWAGMLIIFFLWFIMSRAKGGKERIGYLIGAVVIYAVWQFVGELAGGGLTLGGLVQTGTGQFSGDESMNVLIASRSGAITDPFAEHSMISRFALWRFLFDTSLNFDLALMGRGLGMINADSMYFTYLADFGYPGFIFILYIVITFITRGFQAIDTAQTRDDHTLATGITVMNLLFAIVNITGSHIHAFPGDVYFWFWNGVLLKLSTTATKSNGSSDEKTVTDTRLRA